MHLFEPKGVSIVKLIDNEINNKNRQGRPSGHIP